MSSNLKASRFETQASQYFSQSLKAGKKLNSQFKGSQAGDVPSYLWEGQPFVICRPAADCMRLTQIREGNLLGWNLFHDSTCLPCRVHYSAIENIPSGNKMHDYRQLI